MAKRQRGSNRPAHRRPSQRPGGRPATRSVAAAPRPAGTLTPEEELRAAEIEARILAEEQAAEDARRRSRERARSDAVVGRRQARPLSERAATEYAYVRRDLVRIVRVGGTLLAILALLHVLINVAGVVSI